MPEEKKQEDLINNKEEKNKKSQIEDSLDFEENEVGSISEINSSEKPEEPVILDDKKIGELDEKIVKIKNFLLDKFGKFFEKKAENKLSFLDTDLIKDEVEIKFYWKKDFYLFLVLLSFLAIFVVESYFLLSWWEKKREQQNYTYLESEINYTKSQADALHLEYEEASKFNNKLSSASIILNKHIYWSNFFNFLESNTLKNNIYYKNFSGNIFGDYIIPTVSNDVLAMSFQSRAFLADPLVSSVVISEEEIINDEKNKKTLINFNLNFKLNPSIFN